jgi:hypothetical protein
MAASIAPTPRLRAEQEHRALLVRLTVDIAWRRYEREDTWEARAAWLEARREARRLADA